MRKTILSLLLAATGAIGLAGSTTALAEHPGRIYVDIDDVAFSYGRPVWRYSHEPLYVVYERGHPRYYRYAAPGHARWHGPRHRDRYWRPARYAPRYYHYDHRWGRYRNWDGDVVIEYRDWD